ncbi:MAG: murein biosynthesis integral membrane protein MurJ [Silanimonas sp.]
MSGGHRKALGLSALNGASKLLAIGKTMLVAALFGASASLDAFWVAYSLPLLLPSLLTTVVTVAFVPRFMASLEGRDGPEAWAGANTFFTVIIGISLVASVAMYVYADALVGWLAPGLATEARAEAVSLSRLLLPCVPLLTLSSVLSALSNARERFVLPALEGVLTNVTVIAAALLLATHLGVTALTLGVLAGFVLQAGVLLWGNRADLRRSIRPRLALRHPDFLGPAAHLLPLFVGSAGSVLTGLINQYFLSHGDEGAISAMAYAAMFAFLPVEVFAQAVITTVYPTFGRHFARGEVDAAAKAFADGVRFLLFLTLPAAVLLILFAEPMVALLLERGAFTAAQTALTADITQVLALGLIFRSAAFFNYRVLHAAVRPWLQVAIGLLGVATHLALCHAWGDQGGAVGVAWAASLSMLQSALLSLLAAVWVLRWRWPAALWPELLKLAVVASAMAAVGALLLPAVWPTLAGARVLHAIEAMGVALLAGVAGLLCAWLLRQPDLRWMAAGIWGKLRRGTAP